MENTAIMKMLVHMNTSTRQKSWNDLKIKNFKGKKIITVSGINPTKGLEYFLKMASEIVAKYEDICFFIAAPNLKSQKNYFKKLENIISSSHLNDQNCKFLGMISDVPSPQTGKGMILVRNHYSVIFSLM